MLGRTGHLLPPVLVGLMLALLYKGDDLERLPPPVSVAAPPPAVAPAQENRWRAAARLVEEDRGEPIGRSARVRVPPQLQHYPDRRRFLAVQVAAWMETDYPIPHDDAQLAEMIGRGELVEIPPLGDDYILYGVGANATSDPLAHFDRATGEEIPLYARYDLFQDAAAEWSAAIDARKAAAAEATAQAAKLPKAQARRRRGLLAQARTASQEASALEPRLRRVAAWYDDYDRRRLLVSEYETLADLARKLRKRPYDLDDPKDRRAFRGRLLSYLRPPARDMMRELARRYHDRFGRPLPVTSLVRSEDYQRHLGETNPNATRISIPPHTTGLAFDIYYHYMTATEQNALMDMVAQAERDGRLEALRETRDHIHALAFPDGRPPPEALIAQARGVVRPGSRVASSTEGGGRDGSIRAASTSPRMKVAAARHASTRKAVVPVKRAGQRTSLH